LRRIDGSGEYLTDLDDNVEGTLKFWDEINSWPAVHLNAGSERREYQAGGYKDRFLVVTVRCYVNNERSSAQLDELLQDVETVLEEADTLWYFDRRGKRQKMHQITILGIDTDEGVLAPLGVGELVIEVWY
jgi:hypothetical protein